MGAALAQGALRAAQALLAPLNPLVYGSVAAFFGLVAARACLMPAVRASRINPVAALAGGHTRRT